MRPRVLPACHKTEDGSCACSVPGVDPTTELEVWNRTDWFGGGPDSPGVTGFGATSAEGQEWWHPSGGGLFFAVPRPTSALVSESVVCLTFDDELYALQPRTLAPLSSKVGLLDRLAARSSSWALVVPVALIALIGLFAFLFVRRLLSLARVFGASGERAREGRWNQAGTVVCDARHLRARRVRWHGPSAPDGADLVLVALEPIAGAGASYRTDEALFAILHAFAGDRARLVGAIAARAARARRIGRAALAAQLGLLLVLALCLWAS